MIIWLAVLVFLATNIDDLLILMAFFANPTYQPRAVVIGQFLGFTLILIVCAVASLLALVIPAQLVQGMGIFPLWIGLRDLWKQWHERADDDDHNVATPTSTPQQILSVSAVTMANSGDNVGVYIPLFATQHPLQTVVMVVIFWLMTSLWCGIAYYFVRHPRWQPIFYRYGQRLVPWVLIALGIMILFDIGF